MPNMIALNEGKPYFLTWLFAANPEDVMKIGLFQNDFVVAEGSELADFTPSSFSGYSAITIVRSQWTVPVVVGDVGEIVYDPAPEFTCNAGSPQTAYGWYMWDDSEGVAVLAQNFNTPRVMAPITVMDLNPFKVKLKTFA